MTISTLAMSVRNESNLDSTYRTTLPALGPLGAELCVNALAVAWSRVVVFSFTASSSSSSSTTTMISFTGFFGLPLFFLLDPAPLLGQNHLLSNAF